MRLFALGFVPGTLALHLLAQLPGAQAPLGGAALALALARWLQGQRALRAFALMLAGVLAGLGHAAWRSEARLADALPFALEGRDIVVEGVVAQLPQAREAAVRFVFHVERADSVPRVIALSWFAARGEGEEGVPLPRLEAGERWRLAVRLKRPRGHANPHGFDFESWSLQRGIRATGYVRAQPHPVRLEARVDGWPQTLHRWRGEVRATMAQALGDARFRGVLTALVIGDQDAIAPADWEVFWRTGVGHLMSISGLHITMLAALAFAVVFAAWARIPALALRLPARKAAVVAGALAALAYTLMTGFAVPAQRTFTMLAVLACFVLADRHASASRVIAVAAVAVLVLDPWAVLSAGFWLSFGAVAAIFYAMALRCASSGWITARVVEQLAVTVAMLPMLVALFREFSLVSPIANALAIPVVSLVVVPLAIAGAFLGTGLLLEVAHAALVALMAPLEALAAWPDSMLEAAAPGPWAILAALAGALWLLAPRGVPMRSCGALWMAPLFAFPRPAPAPGEAWIDMLDVGNGLAVVVRTARHALVFDAGPRGGGEFDSGERIVVPFLRGEGLRRLDGLVVSHADDDHVGGAASVARRRAPSWLLSSLPAGHPLHEAMPSVRCEYGQGWEWDGVSFTVLHPGPEAYGEVAPGGWLRPRKANDRSCVLRVATAGARALLTGDIEARSESEMLARGADLRADLLLVPHHGSRTSSTERFLDAVAPSVALVSSGYRSRFGHPHASVMARYASRGIALHRTDRDGALRATLRAESSAPPRVEPSVPHIPYWSDRRRSP